MNHLKTSSKSSIRMGEMSVASDGEELRTLLGSCVGVALYDRHHKIAGLAHIVLPRAPRETDKPGKFVDTAVPLLVETMNKIVHGELKLTAKIAGGASMFSTTTAGNIGDQNIESCTRQLDELGIPILARHCGGKKGRRMSLDSFNGTVRIEIVGEDLIEL